MSVDDNNQRNTRSSVIDPLQNLSLVGEGATGSGSSRTESEGDTTDSGAQARRQNSSSQGGKQTPNNLNTEGT